MNIELGRTYKDKITGFVGVCTGHCLYISGCDQALLQPPIDKDGKKVDPGWYDIQRLELVGETKIVLDNAATPGCDESAPIR